MALTHPEDRKSTNHWCNYCKDEVFENDDYVKIKGLFYHFFCWSQENTIQDGFFFGEEENPNEED